MAWYRLVPRVLQTLAWGPTRIILRYFCKFEVYGLENLKDLRQAIFAPNHRNEMDPIVVTAALSPFSRFAPIFYVADPPTTFQQKTFGWRRFLYTPMFFKAWGAYAFIPGLKSYERALRQHLEILKDGGSLLIFPEGLRKKVGEEGEGKGGVSHLSLESGVPVIPVSISGLSDASPRSFLKKGNRIIVRFGEPVFSRASNEGDSSHKSFAREVMLKVRKVEHAHLGVHQAPGHHRDSILSLVFDWLTIPILNNLPVSLRGLLKKTHDSAERIINERTKYAALETLYGGEVVDAKSWQRFFRKLWFRTRNARAVQNRLRLVRHELIREFQNIPEGSSFKVLSIASGSARAVIEAALSHGSLSGRAPIFIFLDKDPGALSYSRDLANKLSFGHESQWVESAANSFLSGKAGVYKIVEMVGLLDYFKDEEAVRLLSAIYESLIPGGVLITANIIPNRESKFVGRVLDWKMIYRAPEELAYLLRRAGFEGWKMETHVEPMHIHCVIMARK